MRARGRPEPREISPGPLCPYQLDGLDAASAVLISSTVLVASAVSRVGMICLLLSSTVVDIPTIIQLVTAVDVIYGVVGHSRRC
jgi:hypothetical protein